MSAFKEPLRENLRVPKYGSFVATEEEVDSEDEDADDTYQSIDYKDMTKIVGGSKLAEMKKPKKVRGTLYDFINGRTKPTIEGCIHLPSQWWNTRVLRTKFIGQNFYVPRDNFALSYALRQDDRVVQHGLVPMFLQSTEAEGSDINRFLDYVGHTGQKRRLKFEYLRELLSHFEEFLPEAEKSVAVNLKKCFLSDEGKLVERGIAFPLVFQYLPQLLPLHFLSIIKEQKEEVLEKLEEAIIDRPWVFGFKKLMNKNFGIIGTEAQMNAYETTGFLEQLENPYKDALIVYEYLKRQCRKDGHTRIARSSIMEEFEGKLDCQRALSFLSENKITKELKMSTMQVMLYNLWYSEMSISRGIDKIFRSHMSEPWILNIDLQNHQDFEKVRQDDDQMRAARMINRLPVVVVSGKGGCGKTTVVTTILSNAEKPKIKPREEDQEMQVCDGSKQVDNNGVTNIMLEMNNNTRESNTNNGTPESKGTIAELKNVMPDSGKSSPDSKNCSFEAADASPEKWKESVDIFTRYPNVLYLAPTGKAAKLLGNRAGTDGFTLHQIIWSYKAFIKKQMQGEEATWRFSSIDTLVVDECSLVSVENFSTILELLLENTELRKIVLLGDVRQLPSIDPGNFLSDIFKCLEELGCAIELRTNHRAESELIVANATKISFRKMPIFDPQRHFKLHRVPNDPQADFHNSVLLEMLKKEESLRSDRTSHIVAFRRDTCMWINEMCCQFYNNHSIRNDRNKPDFRPEDKVCMFKNGQIPIYQRTSEGFENILINVEESEDPGMETVLEMSQCEGGDLSSQQFQGEGHGCNLDDTALQSQTVQNSKKKDKEVQKVRLCNGEIFFIKDDCEVLEKGGRKKSTRYILLSDEDPKSPTTVWVTYHDLRKSCNMKHAWAKTIHTFQGSECEAVVYVVGNCGFQNWQHVYTAVTRGRKAVHIVSIDEYLEKVVQNTMKPRNTSLAYQMKNKLPRRRDLEDCLRSATTPTKSTTPAKPATNKIRDNMMDTTNCVPVTSFFSRNRETASSADKLSHQPIKSPSSNKTAQHCHSKYACPCSATQGQDTKKLSIGQKKFVSESKSVHTPASETSSNVLTSTCFPGTSRSQGIPECITDNASPIPNVRRNLMNSLSDTDSFSPQVTPTSFPAHPRHLHIGSRQKAMVAGISPALKLRNTSCDSQWSETDEKELIDIADQTAAEFFDNVHGTALSDIKQSARGQNKDKRFTNLKMLHESDILFDSSSFSDLNSCSSLTNTSVNLDIKRHNSEPPFSQQPSPAIQKQNGERLLSLDSESSVQKNNCVKNVALRKCHSESTSAEPSSQSISLLGSTSSQNMSLFARIKEKSAQKRSNSGFLVGHRNTLPDDNNEDSSTSSTPDTSTELSTSSLSDKERTPPKLMKMADRTQVTPIIKCLRLSKDGI